MKKPQRPQKRNQSGNNRPQKPRKSPLKIERKAPELTVKKSSDGSIRLNKYISNSGICSRREADVMIESGAVSVNNKVVTTMGFKVQPGDIVKCDGHTITPEKRQYVLLNKPKNFTAVMDDPLNRRSVAQLMKGACKEPVYPVGKMDRQTTGLLLFTNDGELSKKLNHPKQGVRTIYHITCKEKVKSTHLQEMIQGVEIEGYFVRADAVEYIGDGENPHEIGMEIKSSRVKSVERLFAHFGYSITKMDRVVFAHLTKKDLPRGRFRHLTKEEVNYLKMI